VRRRELLPAGASAADIVTAIRAVAERMTCAESHAEEHNALFVPKQIKNNGLSSKPHCECVILIYFARGFDIPTLEICIFLATWR